MTPKIKTPWWYWTTLAGLFVWAGIAVWFYWIDRTLPDAEYLDLYGNDLLDMRGRVPLWATAAYAIGVWGGLLGCAALLLRKKWALPVYVISFAGALIAWAWNIADETGRASLEGGGWVMLVIVLGMCLFQIWFTRLMRDRGVLT